MVDIIIARLKEPSTWRGLVAIGAVVGWNITPELQQHIVALAVALLGIIEVVRAERKAAHK